MIFILTTIFLFKKKKKNLYLILLHTFEVLLFSEAQCDLVAIPTGALTLLCDAETEAWHAVAAHAKVSITAITC